MDDLEIFDCQAIDVILEYKWKNYARKIHLIGLMFHLVYVLFFSWYVSSRFVYHDDHYDTVINSVMTISLMYPLVYDMTQLKK